MTKAMESYLEFIDDLEVVTEELSDISTFIEDPDRYLEVSYREAKLSDPDTLYTGILDTGGDLFISIMKAGAELVKVNAYSDAIILYTKMIDKLEELKNGLSKDDIDNLSWSIDELKTSVIQTMKLRDEYSSRRKSIVAKYSEVINKLK